MQNKNISQMLISTVREENEYKLLYNTLNKFNAGGSRYTQGPALITGLSDGVRNVLCAATLLEESLKKDKTGVVIVPDEKTAYNMLSKLSAFMDGVYVFPVRDFNFHNIGSASKEWEYERLKVLRAVVSGNCSAVICVPEAALSILPPKKYMEEGSSIKIGDTVPVNELLITLEKYGYSRCDTVEGQGQYSARGDIVDIFIPDNDYPVRLEFFGDELDAAGYFDTMTQRRTENVMEIDITPVREVMISPEKRTEISVKTDLLIATALKKKNQKLAEKLQKEKVAVESGDFHGVDKYLPAIYDELTTLFDYTDGICVVCDYPRVRDRLNSYLWQLHQTVTDLASQGEMIIKDMTWCKSYEDLKHILSKRPCVVTDTFTSTPDFEISGLFEFTSKQTVSVECGTDILCDDLEGYIHQGYKTVLCVRGAAHASSLYDMLSGRGINAVVSSGTELSSMSPKHIYIIPKENPADEFCGFELTKSKFAFLCEDAATQSASARAVKSNDKAKRSAKKKILSYLELTEGDYVVHETHGIGQYLGIKTLTVAGVTRDYITIKYAGKDSLYVPCDQLDKVSKYSGKSENVVLSKMGGGDWIKKKQRAKKAAKDMAKELIALYAERSRRPGYAFSADTDWQREFEDGFEYEETEGQLEAIREIKNDMEKPCPMDRLLCGDVGFGKTEVALRAAFKCVMDGKQAAVLVPTTILAFQHFRTFSSRMHGFPIRVEMLSRYVSPKKAKEVLKRLENGETDIVVGTHKLLGKNVKFKDLGLLIVDEEQRFGVAHKERLKEISRQVDVLTLTATPIPRTFNMALVGIRDMSVLEEAPIDRYPVQTYVLEYDHTIVMEAIKKELRRGGQVFYMHNKVDDIQNVAAHIQAEVPDAVVSVAHGQMDKEELSEIWYDMTEGKIDVLVCTTIIETGVDVPNANTLIIEDADRLGLSQLHQIRGRVGRSNRRAYAYFTWKPQNMLNEIAQKRLIAIKEFTEFGSGFRIAMRDLEIRGAGNLLGAEQSGQMEAVGYDMFVKILEQAVLEEKGETPEERAECTIDLGVSAYIPEKYIKRPSGRIEMYKRISEIRSKSDADDVIDEMTDRYGEIPKETKNLILIASIKARCTDMGIVKVEYRPGKLAIYPSTAPTKEQSIAMAQRFPGRVLTSLGQKPCFNVKMQGNDSIEKVLEEIFKIYSPNK